MAYPGELVSSFGAAFAARRFKALAASCAYPCVVSIAAGHAVVATPDEMIEAMESLAADLSAQGMRGAATELDSQVVLNDELAFLNATTVYHDAQGAEVTRSQCSYIFRSNGCRWEMLSLSVDRAAAHGPGACTLTAMAA